MFGFSKKYDLYVFEFSESEKSLQHEIEKIEKKCKNNYFDSYVDRRGRTFLLFANFKTNNLYNSKVIEMFSYLIYAYTHKNDINIFGDLLFKIKTFKETSKLIHLRYNVKQ